MQNIPITLAKPDMVIAKDVKRPGNAGSLPVCGKGTILTEELIKRFIEMGIQTITVEGHPVLREGEASLEEMIEKLHQRFKRVEDDSGMMKLKEIYRKRIIRSMSE